MITRVTLTYRDRYGRSAIIRFHVDGVIVDPNDPDIAAVVSAINAITRAVCITIEISIVDTYTGTAGTGPTVAQDKALLVTKDDEDDNHLFRVPGPKLAVGTTIFLSDNVTVDLANASVAALSASIATNAKSTAGGSLTAIREGHRTEGKTLKN